MLGLSPEDVNCWIMTKTEIIKLWKDDQIIKGQHTGREGGDAAWIHINPNDSEFYNKYEGNLNKALNIIAKLTNFYPKSLSVEFDK